MKALGPMPSLEFKHAPCVKCGARTERQAETKCKPVQDMSGEYECPGEFDKQGKSIVPTELSIRRLDAWCKADGERMDWEFAARRTELETGK